MSGNSPVKKPAPQVDWRDQEIERLRLENDKLREKFMALLDPQAFAVYKAYTRERKDGQARKPMTLDKETGKLREKTDAEISQEFKALQDLGIL